MPSLGAGSVAPPQPESTLATAKQTTLAARNALPTMLDSTSIQENFRFAPAGDSAHRRALAPPDAVILAHRGPLSNQEPSILLQWWANLAPTMSAQPARRPAAVAKQSVRRLPQAVHSTSEQILTTHTPELVIALCGPIGSPLHEVASALKGRLTDEYGYECHVIKPSQFIAKQYPVPEEAVPVERAHHLIDKGNRLRETYGNSVLAELAVRQISLRREAARERRADSAETEPSPNRFAPDRICHIIDSIKNGAELDTLRLVYGPLLHTIGVFASERHRKIQLKRLIPNESEVEKLMARDAQEGLAHGQSVRSTFPHCDYFVREDVEKSKLERKLSRLLKLIFGIGVNTPTTSETAMYQAASAALSSACLSRQVGAAILDKNEQLLAVGWNDVPKPSGGVYTSADEPDCRCCNYGEALCHNDAQKLQIAQKVAQSLVDQGLIVQADVPRAIEVVKASPVGSLIEFSRAVHAEMHAIILGSQLSGDRMKGASLYSTTYPCHSCARHIVLAGITTVYYIEPYPKSQAIALHDDSISESESDTQKVRFLPYEGVGPNRYLKMFAVGSGKRKSEIDGKLVRLQKSTALPKDNRSLESFPTLEGLVVSRLLNRGILSQNAPSHE